MAKEKIRLGIIGCGGIARSRHITGLTALKRAGLDNFEVTALCDTVEDNLMAVAAHARDQQGARPQLYNDWKELIAKAPVDAVDICLPHGLHHVVGIAALNAGLHVVMEKPYTVSVKTGRALAEAADASGKVLATAVPHRRMPGQRAVHWAINEAKLIGEPRLFFANYTQYRAPAPADVTRPAVVWRRDRFMGGGAGVIDSGFHFLDTVEYFFGKPESVSAQLRAWGPGSTTASPRDFESARENTAVVTINFESGLVGTWCWSFAVPGKETRDIVLYGSDGSIEDTGYSDRFVVYHLFMGNGEFRGKDGSYLSMSELQAKMRQDLGPDRLQRLYPNGVTDHFATELWDFLDAVENDRQPEVNGWGGLATIGLVEGIYESAISGHTVKIADILSGAAYHGWQREIDEYWDERPIPTIKRG